MKLHDYIIFQLVIVLCIVSSAAETVNLYNKNSIILHWLLEIYPLSRATPVDTV